VRKGYDIETKRKGGGGDGGGKRVCKIEKLTTPNNARAGGDKLDCISVLAEGGGGGGGGGKKIKEKY